MSESPAELPLEEYGSFPPGTIVLAKLKSFPPWPGIVIPNELIPQGIFQSKPKPKPKVQGGSAGRARGRRSGRGGRKAGSAVVTEEANVDGEKSGDGNADDDKLWCVRFLRDDTFMWATNNDISLLDEDTIKAYLEKNKKAKKTIRGAYEMALNPPDLEEFIIYGSDGKPIQVDNEADDEDFNDEYIEDDDENDEEEEEEEEDDDDEDEEMERVITPRKRRKPATPKKKAAAASPVKRRGRPPSKKSKIVIEEEPDTSGDEDWEDDIYEETETVAIDIPNSKDLQYEIKSFSTVLKKFKSQLLIIFTPLNKEDINDFELNAKDIKSLTMLMNDFYNDEEIPPVALIKHFGINKIIFNILRQPILSKRKDLVKFREKLNSFVEELFGFEINLDESWTYKEPEKIEEKEEEQVEEKIEEKTEEKVQLNGETKEEVKEESNQDSEKKEDNQSNVL